MFAESVRLTSMGETRNHVQNNRSLRMALGRRNLMALPMQWRRRLADNMR
jgi:hypothetical protein